LLRAGYFGSVQDMPREIQGRNYHFKFTSPLHDAIERREASTFLESADLIERALAIDPSAPVRYNSGEALADALHGIGVKARHVRSKQEVEQILAAHAEQAQAEEQVELAKGGAQAARDMAQANAA
jgi:hypothetical protein